MRARSLMSSRVISGWELNTICTSSKWKSQRGIRSAGQGREYAASSEPVGRPKTGSLSASLMHWKSCTYTSLYIGQPCTHKQQDVVNAIPLSPPGSEDFYEQLTHVRVLRVYREYWLYIGNGFPYFEETVVTTKSKST